MADKPREITIPAADKKTIATAKKRFKVAMEAEHKIREDALDDLKFLAGEQWPEHIKADREREGRILLTINRLPAILHQVSNAIRQNRVSGKVSPVDDKADVDTAEVMQGHIRHIEYDSNAMTAYTNAGFYAAGIGMGYWEVMPEYSDQKSFTQDLKIKMVENPLTILLDPNSIEPDGSDADWYFKICDYSKDEYMEEHPDSNLAQEADWTAFGSTAPDWVKSDGARVVEYTYREKKSAALYQMQDGSAVLEDDLQPEHEQMMLRDGEGKPRTRDTQVYAVKWCKLNGVEILDRTDKPGKYLGIVKVTGDRFVVDGRRIQHGVIRHAKEPQRQYNYMKSAQTEAIALTPKAKWVAAEGQIDGRQRKNWEQANNRNIQVLEYKQVDGFGKPAPPPTQILPQPNVAAITEALSEAHSDLQFTTGIHDAMLGAKSNETSGTAIQGRKIQGETGNFHYVDNLSISIGFSCKQIVDMAPFIYDTARSIRIIGEDDTHKIVKLNQPTDHKGQQKTFRYDVGKYDVVCTAGPSFQTKLQEAAESTTELIKAFPALMPIAGDLLVKSLNIPYGQELSERLKKQLPPELQEPQDGQQPIPPQVQQQMMQMKQQMAALNAYAQSKEQELEKLQQEKAGKVVDNEYRLGIEKMKMANDLAIAEIGAKSQEVQVRMKFEQEQWKQLHGQAHDAGMAAAGAGAASEESDKNIAAAQQAQEAQMAQAQEAQPAQ